jgi:hypothetical protein
MLLGAVLGYRDPLSPWQLARRFRQVSDRANRFAAEWAAEPDNGREDWMFA